MDSLCDSAESVVMVRRDISLLLFATIVLLPFDRSVGQDAQPTAEVILRKYVQAVGGEELLNSVTSMKLNATQTVRNEEGTSESTDTLLVSDGRWVIKNSQGIQSGFDVPVTGFNRKEANRSGRNTSVIPLMYVIPSCTLCI